MHANPSNQKSVPNCSSEVNDDVKTMFTFTCIFVCFTLLLTALATLFLTLSLLSDEWEFINYDRVTVEKIAQDNNHTVEWLPNELARIEREILPSQNSTDAQSPKKKVFYLIPAYGGVNKLCADIPGKLFQISVIGCVRKIN